MKISISSETTFKNISFTYWSLILSLAAATYYKTKVQLITLFIFLCPLTVLVTIMTNAEILWRLIINHFKLGWNMTAVGDEWINITYTCIWQIHSIASFPCFNYILCWYWPLDQSSRVSSSSKRLFTKHFNCMSFHHLHSVTYINKLYIQKRCKVTATSWGFMDKSCTVCTYTLLLKTSLAPCDRGSNCNIKCSACWWKNIAYSTFSRSFSFRLSHQSMIYSNQLKISSAWTV